MDVMPRKILNLLATMVVPLLAVGFVIALVIGGAGWNIAPVLGLLVLAIGLMVLRSGLLSANGRREDLHGDAAADLHERGRQRARDIVGDEF